MQRQTKKILITMTVMPFILSTANAQQSELKNQTFNSPSRNIYCHFIQEENTKTSYVLCDIAEFKPSFDEKYTANKVNDPLAGNLDFKIFAERMPCLPKDLLRYKIASNSSNGEHFCPMVDFNIDFELETPILQYGKSIEIDGIVCMSEQKGMTCTNKQGHGFFLSKAKQEIF